MQIPMEIRYRDMSPSEALNDEIHEEAAKLEKLCERITSCKVTIEQPHRHHAQGRHFHVQIDLRIPGDELVVGRDPEKNDAFENAHVAVAAQFEALRRMLQKRLERRREHAAKTTREAPPA